MPSKVVIFCPMLEFKNKPATLMTISPNGYYEFRIDMAAGNHTFYLPIASTALIFTEPNTIGAIPKDIERWG
ncbi:MAG TPA: hypothetical protein VH854_02195 [Thermoanaerobaculia bacterium]|jgi:hypothetical protein|nr:hypothetical protein [Thermoanaerobaculia bacterium]